ncbi:hypothetical protein CVO76_10995 [Arthrobacter agilis]|uniref:DSBA-like thioredoxin domain-containing protein n=1 Tax=Arthrobacter agilis TaxID=37921 RepID=A0A2L0UFV3_9MICC|nr:DsbA family protein [Arthrobacter agilis]AUZ88098.1 hypothetical protein CVO76_10995 [Arthrobacter agilis]
MPTPFPRTKPRTPTGLSLQDRITIGLIAAAAAVGTAVQQGGFRDRHARMDGTQAQWGHTDEDRSPVFRGYAEELGLDLAAVDAAVEGPATMERIQKDKADGMAPDVQGTPAFFLDGGKIQPSSGEEFRRLIETAISQVEPSAQ